MAPASPLLAIPSIAADLGRVEEALRVAVRSEDPYLTEVASHLIHAGGKRGRPAFAIGAAATASSDIESVSDDVVWGAVAVELVHLGSLYHDDVMDEATTRRTVASVNARWGNLQAILAGDYLLAKASEIASSLGTEIAGLLARTIGRLCEGQVLELQHTYDVGRTEVAYLTSIEGKTAALYATACRIGALTAGLSTEAVAALTEFGRQFGMAFQIVDDILDVTATDEQLGKPAGHDLIEGVYTLPVLRVLARDDEAAASLRALLGSPLTDDQMHQARALVRDSGEVGSSLEVARTHVEGAVSALHGCDALAGREATEVLSQATRHLLSAADAIVVSCASS